MAYVFPNVSLLGINQNSRFFDAGFQYSNEKRLSIQGLVIDLTNTFGITGIWTGQEGIVNTVRNDTSIKELVLNGVSFGTGRIQSISFDPGIDVRTKGYQAELIVYDSGNLFNLTGFFYSGIDISNFQYLQNFSENYAFNKKQNGGYSYTHDASIKFNSGVGQLQAIPAAQALARSLFTGSNLGLAFYSGYTNKQGKRYNTESYNLIDNSCAFSETFEFDRNLGVYSAIYTNSVQLGDDGVVTAIEDAQIKGIENPNYQKALSAVATEMTGSYYRCSGAVNYYFPTGAILITSPISQGRSIDIFDNNIQYTVQFNNNPNNSGSYFWDYTTQVTREQGIGTVTENGSIQGRGQNRTLAFLAAQNGLSVVRNGIEGRVNNLFASTFGSTTNYLENKQESYSPFQSQAGYNYQYSNNPDLIANSGVRKLEINQNDVASIYAINHINIFNYKEIVQDDKQSTVASRTINITMEGDKTVNLPNYIALADLNFNLLKPVGNEVYIANATYSYDPNAGNTNANLEWVYNVPVNRTIYP